MTIKRNIDGKEIEIELTNDEIERAYRIRELYYYTEDVRERWVDLYNTECPYNNVTVEKIAKSAQRISEWNDAYFEGYWSNIDTAIVEYLKNKI